MIKHCNTIQFKSKYNGEINEIDEYVKTFHILNGISTYTDRLIRRLLDLMAKMQVLVTFMFMLV